MRQPIIQFMKQSGLSKIFFIIALLPTLLLPSTSTADTQEKDTEKVYDTFTVFWENDTFAGTDRNYTNGFKMTWSTPFGADKTESNLPDWSYYFIDKLPFFNGSETKRAVSVSFGQDIYTPENVYEKDLIVDDRPYAGYLYYSTAFHNRTSNRKNSWEFQFGIVGPLSFAEETQNLIHDILGSKRSEGWDNQLENEVTFEAIYESKWLLYYEEKRAGYGYDLIPHIGIRIGSVSTYINVGAEIRYGLNLPGNFGNCLIRAGCAPNSAFNNAPRGNYDNSINGWHIFFAMDGRVVLHDIFLDGNNFTDSHSVEREVWVADLMAGVAVDFGNTIMTYSYVFRTKQFEAEENNHMFGSLSLSWTY